MSYTNNNNKRRIKILCMVKIILSHLFSLKTDRLFFHNIILINNLPYVISLSGRENHKDSLIVRTYSPWGRHHCSPLLTNYHHVTTI